MACTTNRTYNWKTMIIYHNNREVKTIKDLMEYKHIISTNDFTYKEFFDENRTRIFQQLDDEQKCELAVKTHGDNASINDLTEGDLKYDMNLPFPCTLEVDIQYVTSIVEITETNFQENADDFFVFENEQISKITLNKGYVINKTTKKQRPDLRVFGYFKTLHRTKQIGNAFGTTYGFTDISSFVKDINTSVTKSGGNFRITLPLIGAKKFGDALFIDNDTEGDWFYGNLREGFNGEINEENNINSLMGVHYNIDGIHFKSTVKDNDESIFDILIQNNDLIFINFGDDIRAMEEDVGMRCFDMIGLVDDVSLSQNANGSGCVVVSGRDLMKLITDDSSLFFTKSTAWGGSNIFGNIESYEKTGDILSSDMTGEKISPINRLRRYSTEEINIFAYPNKTLDYIIKGVVQKLVNIEICPSQLFQNWGNRLTKFNEFEYEENSGDNNSSDELDLNNDEEINVDAELNAGLNMNRNDKSKGGEAFEALLRRNDPSRLLNTNDIELGTRRF